MSATDLKLNDVPDSAWLSEYAALMKDDWLRDKLDRDKRIHEHLGYIARYVPEFYRLPKGLVIDVGPGPGEFLEIARANGHHILGVDASTGDGGMGDSYLAASKLMSRRQNIPVRYVGFQNWLNEDHAAIEGSAVLINFRGSFEQAFSDYLTGIPHDEHHCAKKLDWRIGSRTEARFLEAFRLFERLLSPGGILLIHANGTGSRESQLWYDRTVQMCGEEADLELVMRPSARLHRWWRKPE